ncbi:hypothetical protein LTR62_004081 [Meristemomyces frigidus]|uniref:DUF302 domain-containing protein n=1 Tax=Meristemomyces frigidus TaxID=1508187 RepID=A0AAN7TJD4_9PEZI|nr:hypothetical protein LTR62_004081 [Meristemomyces frigidus]
MATTFEETYSVTRITRTIAKPHTAVLAKLYSSIKNKEDSGLTIVEALENKQQFEEATNAHLGPHGFMHFKDFQHGAWMGLYGVHKDRASTRVIFGNPQIAITMLKHDVRAGLFVPVECLIVEREDGNTDVVMMKPSGLIAGYKGAGEELKKAAEMLDQKLDKLWEWVAEE